MAGLLPDVGPVCYLRLSLDSHFCRPKHGNIGDSLLTRQSESLTIFATTMGFLDKLAHWLAPSVPPPPALQPPVAAEFPVPAVPAVLPKIAAKTAAEICKDCKPEAEAKLLLTQEQTPSQFLAALQEKNLGAEMVKVLAHGLADREGVAWAVQCAQKVAGLLSTLPAADVQAMKAAKAWVKNPTAEKQKIAAAAAELTDYQGPGAWAAQAVAWAGDGAPKSSSAAGGAPPRLTPQAVAAAVLLASTIQARPEFAKRQLTPMQMPALQMPSAADAFNAHFPQISGAPAHLQAGIKAPQALAGMAGFALDPNSIAGAVSLPSAAGAAPQLAVPGLSGMGAALGGIPSGALPAVSVPSLPGMSGVSLPGMALPAIPGAGQLSSLSSPNIPQIAVPTIPPAVHAFLFKEQQDFIGLGLGIASGVAPLI